MGDLESQQLTVFPLQNIVAVLCALALISAALQQRVHGQARAQLAERLERVARAHIQRRLRQGEYAVSKKEVEQHATHSVMSQQATSTRAVGASPHAPLAQQRKWVSHEWSKVARRLDADKRLRSSTLSSIRGTEPAWTEAERVFS